MLIFSFLCFYYCYFFLRLLIGMLLFLENADSGGKVNYQGNGTIIVIYSSLLFISVG